MPKKESRATKAAVLRDQFPSLGSWLWVLRSVAFPPTVSGIVIDNRDLTNSKAISDRYAALQDTTQKKAIYNPFMTFQCINAIELAYQYRRGCLSVL